VQLALDLAAQLVVGDHGRRSPSRRPDRGACPATRRSCGLFKPAGVTRVAEGELLVLFVAAEGRPSQRLTMMTKSPPSVLGVNVGLCLPRNRLAAATARRPSTTSLGVDDVPRPRGVTRLRRVGGHSAYLLFSRVDPGDPGAGQACCGRDFSATDVDPSPGVPHAQRSSLPAVIRAGQKRVDDNVTCWELPAQHDPIRSWLVG